MAKSSLDHLQNLKILNQFRLSRNRPASVSLLGLMQILPEVTFQEHR